MRQGVALPQPGVDAVADHAQPLLLAEAGRELAGAVEVFEAHGLPWDRAESLHVWGRALLDAGDRAAARDRLDAALRIYRDRRAGEVWSERVLADRRRAE